MKVFVTGGTGFIGTAVVRELRSRGHQVLALARSEASAARLQIAGAQVHHGSLEDPGSLARGAAQCDGVAHLGFIHDFGRFAEVCAVDARAIETLGQALGAGDRPLVVASGVALLSPGRRSTEADTVPAAAPHPRAATELAVKALVDAGVRAMPVRLAPSVHGAGDHGFVAHLVGLAREKGASGKIASGSNRWCAVHRDDAARLFVQALEQGRAGERFHAVGEPEVRFDALAAAIGAGLDLPVHEVPHDQVEAWFGWFSAFAGLDCPASSAWTRERLGWEPTGPTLLDDLANGLYFNA